MSADFPDKNGEKLQELQWIAGIEKIITDNLKTEKKESYKISKASIIF